MDRYVGREVAGKENVRGVEEGSMVEEGKVEKEGVVGEVVIQVVGGEERVGVEVEREVLKVIVEEVEQCHRIQLQTIE